MTNTEKNHQISDDMVPVGNDVEAGLVRMNAADLGHRVILSQSLFDSLDREANCHEAFFDKSRFPYIDNAVNKEIESIFLCVALRGLPLKIAGTMVYFPSVSTQWTGDRFVHMPALYVEDFSVDPSFAKLFREQTISPKNPKGLGLGTYFQTEVIKRAITNADNDLPSTLGYRSLLVEHSSNKPVVQGILNKFNATLERDPNNTIVYFPNDLPFGKQRANIPVEVGQLGFGADKSERFFTISTVFNKDRTHLCASFTKGLSTFTGDPIIRVQLTSNHIPAAKGQVKEALLSLFKAGQKEVLKREWLSSLSGGRSSLTVSPISTMRIHALNDTSVNALRDLGAQPRYLGSHLMKPAEICFENCPPELLKAELPRAVAYEESITLIKKCTRQSTHVPPPIHSNCALARL